MTYSSYRLQVGSNQSSLATGACYMHILKYNLLMEKDRE